MNNQFAPQFDTFLRGVAIPPQVAQLVEDNISKARSTYETAAESWKAYGEALTSIAHKQQSGAQAIGNRALENASTNLESTFDTMQALTRSRSLQEAVKIHTDFSQQQSARLMTQTQEMLELMTKIGTDAFATWSSVAQRPA
jgi:phasin family protein